MLMMFGPFIFSIPTYSVEHLSRSVSFRAASQEVIGARPPTHLLGPGEETVHMSSTFYPYHLNGGGLAQLEGIRSACLAGTPLMLLALSGMVFGRWVITDVSDEKTMFGARVHPEQVTVDMSILRYVPRGGGGLF